jgi:hypothetical protein
MVMESGNEGIIDLHASVPDATRFHDRDTSKSAFRSSPRGGISGRPPDEVPEFSQHTIFST